MLSVALIRHLKSSKPRQKNLHLDLKKPLMIDSLDSILISDCLSNLVENISIKPGYRSDHSTVIMELKLFYKGP